MLHWLLVLKSCTIWFRKRPIDWCVCGKVCRPKLRGGSVSSAEVRGMKYTGVLVAGGLCSGAGATADGRRCGKKPRPYWERR